MAKGKNIVNDAVQRQKEIDKWVNIGKQNRERYDFQEAEYQNYWKKARETRQANIDSGIPKQKKIKEFESQQINNTPLMIGTSETQPKEISRRQAAAQEKLNKSALGTGSSPEITSSHVNRQHENSTAKRIDDLLVGEGLDNDYIEDLARRESAAERKILDYSADTGRNVTQLHASNTGGELNFNQPGSRMTGPNILGNTPQAAPAGTPLIGSNANINGQNGTYLNVVEKQAGFDERLRNLDSRKGTSYYNDLKAKDLDLGGASTVEQYRAMRDAKIPSEAAVYKKARAYNGAQGAASKAAKETTEQLTNTTGKIVGKNADDVAKKVSKFGKVGRIAAGLGVGAVVISNMNKNKGQQTNGQLYGQQTPYGY